MEDKVVDTQTRESRPTRCTCRPESREPDRFAVVIRPRHWTLRAWEQLALGYPDLCRSIAARPRHTRAVARAILRHDEAARQRFADEEALARHLSSRR